MKTFRPVSRLLASSVIALALAAPSTAFAQRPAPADLSQAQRVIWNLEDEEDTAERIGDIATLDRLMDDGLVIVLAGGKRFTKQAYLDVARRAKAERKKSAAKEDDLPTKLREVQIVLHGDTAVFECLATFSYKDDAGRIKSATYRDIDVWQKKSGQWKQISGSATPALTPTSKS